MAKKKKVENVTRVKSITANIQPIYASCDSFANCVVGYMTFNDTFESVGVVNGFYKIKVNNGFGYVPVYTVERI